jgi:hypothetical protein
LWIVFAGGIFLRLIFLLINRRIICCPIAKIATRIDMKMIFKVEVKSPMNTESLTTKVSIIEATIIINMIASIKALLTVGDGK